MSEKSNDISLPNVSRRDMLSAIGTGSVVGLAGCTGGDSSSGGNDEDAFYLGESETHDGVRVTITSYRTGDQYAPYEEGNTETFRDDDFEQPPTAGAEFIFIGIVVDNVSEGNRSFPSEEQFILNHNGAQMEHMIPRNQYFTTNNQDEYVSYIATVDEEEARDQGTFPGVSYQAWLIFEVPSGFNPEDLDLTVTYGTEDSGTTEETWYLTNN